jgi:hypothetical protein
MTCKEVNRLLKYDYSLTTKTSHEIKNHARSCAFCNEELAISNVLNLLVTSHGDFSESEQSPWDDVRFLNRIKTRIQEISERKTASWDTAIIAVRGWLLAFGATAILLLVLSSQLATNPSLDQTTSDKVGRSNINWSEELVSTNSSPNLPSEEDSENGH